MKRKVKTRIFLVYLLLLLASFYYRKAASNHSTLPASGWKKIELPVISLKEAATEKTTHMAWRETGNPEGPLLLMIHGSPMASGCFDKLLPHFEKKYRVLLPDLPGFGLSRDEDLPDLSIEAHARYLALMLEAEDLSGVSAIAYSLGGGVALHLAELAPDRIDELILVSSIGVQDHEMLGDYMLNHVLHGLQLTVLTALRELTPHFGLLDRVMINRNYARNFFETDQRPLRKILENWTKPMTIVHGTRDRLVPPSAAREHRRIVPQSTLHWIEGGSHIALMTRAKETAGLIRRGLEENRGVTRSTASNLRVAQAGEPPEAPRLDQTGVKKAGVMTLLALATLASEDLACISGGLLVSRKVISFSTATIGCLVGIFGGDILLFLLGRWGGGWLRKIPFFSRKMEHAKVEAGREWVEKHAAQLIVASRFLPGSRLPTYCSMGATGMPLKKFIAWFALAVLTWTPLLVGLSMIFGEVLLPFFEENEKYLFPGFLILLIGGAILVRILSLFATWNGRRLLLSRWRRLTRWEFWPSWFVYLMLVPSLIRYSLRHRSFSVFTAANPALPCGGLAYEPKLISLEALRSSENAAAFAEVKSREDVDHFLSSHQFDYPVVLKPNTGERGRGVAIVRTKQQANLYMDSAPDDIKIIAQEYIDGPEFGVFYYRRPDTQNGEILAVTEKKTLTLTGDGENTLEHLILADDRAVCMAPFFLKRYHSRIWEVPQDGETVKLAELGTHSRGAIFLDGKRLITEELREVIDRISKEFESFYFGRYDVKAPSADHLSKGEGIFVLEVNGVTSEATNMYDPSYGPRRGMKILRRQWELAYEIGAANRDRGIEPATIRKMWRNVRAYRNQSRFEAPPSA